jgi:hypothetical protein
VTTPTPLWVINLGQGGSWYRSSNKPIKAINNEGSIKPIKN